MPEGVRHEGLRASRLSDMSSRLLERADYHHWYAISAHRQHELYPVGLIKVS